ncbi:hypothetical protein LTV02_26700 [Nocardia yamanashiensis]|uniref:hypothetical protein n=1 Tax=Nocardia yamanashiensis TaxID=209247 RepID=UPI001E34D08D|nr:hypothetical protein [Nocardia yamanashiensis]UGT39631.1 hypothetical protein LTV02_26700 [Nocardia yamanashiensis]
MSRNRGRKARKRGGQASGARLRRPGSCGCPRCRRGEFDPWQLLEGVLAGAAELPADEGAFEGELLAAAVSEFGGQGGPAFAQAFTAWCVLLLETRPGPAALGVLCGLSRLATGAPAAAAAAAVDRLVLAGIALPPWASRLTEPVRPDEFARVNSLDGIGAALVGTFERSGCAHGFLLEVDTLADGSAGQIVPFVGREFETVVSLARDRFTGDAETLPAAEFRRQVEVALAVRAELDFADLHAGVLPFDEPVDGIPPFSVSARVLRAHLRSIALE